MRNCVKPGKIHEKIEKCTLRIKITRGNSGNLGYLGVNWGKLGNSGLRVTQGNSKELEVTLGNLGVTLGNLGVILGNPV